MADVNGTCKNIFKNKYIYGGEMYVYQDGIHRNQTLCAPVRVRVE